MSDEDIGRLILTAQRNYQVTTWWRLAIVWVLGRHLVIDHLDRRARIGLWRGVPYLLTFREVA